MEIKVNTSCGSYWLEKSTTLKAAKKMAEEWAKRRATPPRTVKLTTENKVEYVLFVKVNEWVKQ